jgi:hypothetical protein
VIKYELAGLQAKERARKHAQETIADERARLDKSVKGRHAQPRAVYLGTKTNRSREVLRAGSGPEGGRELNIMTHSPIVLAAERHLLHTELLVRFIVREGQLSVYSTIATSVCSDCKPAEGKSYQATRLSLTSSNCVKM